MSWCFVEEDSFIFVIEIAEMKKTTVVSKVKSSGITGTIRVAFVEGGKKEYLLKDFKPSRNNFSQNFKDCLSSRSAFVKKYSEVASCVKDQSDDDPSSSEESSYVAVEKNLLIQEKDSSKGLASCICVHIDNLVGPSEDRAVRPVQLTHVSELANSFARMTTQSQYKILIGLLVEGNIESADIAGQCKVEVLGGNHTRLALQELHKRGVWRNPLIKVEIYMDIDTEECLRLGVSHNQADTQAMKMSFIDDIRLIRKIHDSPDAREVMKRIFNLKSLKEVRQNLKTHIAIARLSDELWAKVLNVEACWKEKKGMKQTFFTRWLLVKDSAERLSLLDIYLKDGMAAYKEAVSHATVSVRNSKNTQEDNREDNMEDIQNELEENNEKLKNGTKSRGNERLASLTEENGRLKKTLQEQENDIMEKNNIILKLEEECERLRQVLAENKRKHDDVMDQNEKGRHTSSHGLKNVKKARHADEDNTVTVGDTVWARYDDGVSYPAKVLEVNRKKCMIKVQYIEDKVLRLVKQSDVRKKSR